MPVPNGDGNNAMTRNGQRLLMLIDGDTTQRRFVATLAARGGWRTLIAADGEAALATLGTHEGMQLDAVLLDRKGDDPEVAPLIAALRANRPQLPILMLTSDRSVAHAVEAMRAEIGRAHV